ncbi:MAG TPA: hypothetical protein DEA99_03520, partial [Candidatus Omnitrophica bacterium]|nr:hypothetical protein [Candidatus Omnitrophota bacterium]
IRPPIQAEFLDFAVIFKLRHSLILPQESDFYTLFNYKTVLLYAICGATNTTKINRDSTIITKEPK